MGFGQVISALVTPFQKDGSIDYGLYKSLIEYQIQSKVDGIVCFGTTGEAPTLSFLEKEKLLVLAKEVAPPHFKVIANTGTYSTSETVELSKVAKELKADGVLAVTPYYNKPEKRGIIAHFDQIAACGLPVIIYNHPGRTGITLDLELLCILFENPNIVGIKDCTADLQHLRELKHRWKDKVVYSGNDTQLLPEIAVGIDGVISVLSQVFTHEFVELFNGKSDSYLGLTDLMKAIYSEVNPQGIKTLLYLLGAPSMELRLPLVKAEGQTVSAILQHLDKSHLHRLDNFLNLAVDRCSPNR
jgi:4-hydroxy-tetrahydrodipicolinate synthase